MRFIKKKKKVTDLLDFCIAEAAAVIQKFSRAIFFL